MDDECVALEVDHRSVNFGSQREGVASEALELTVRSTGVAAATLSSVLLTGADRASFALVDAGARPCTAGRVLRAGVECTVQVRFVPAGEGRHDAELQVRGEAEGPAPRVAVALTGRGVAYTCLGEVVEGFPSVQAAPGGNSYVLSLAEDGQGGVWGAGAMPQVGGGAGVMDGAVWRFAEDGTLEDGFPETDRPGALGTTYTTTGGVAAVDGSHWVVGFHDPGGQSDVRIRLTRYGLDGELLDEHAVNLDAAVEWVNDITRDRLGRLWMAGSLMPNAGAGVYQKLLLLGWDPVSEDVVAAISPDYNLAPPNHGATALLLDEVRGDVWVLGVYLAQVGGRQDLGLWKFTQGGAVADGFPAVHADPGGGESLGQKMVLDDAGNVWVAGQVSEAQGSERPRWWKFSPQGTLAAGYPKGPPLQGPGGAWAAAALQTVAWAPEGSLWAAGWVRYAGTAEYDVAVWKYDNRGELHPGFPVLLDGPQGAGGADAAQALLVDDHSGRVWVGGYSSPVGGYTQATVWKLQ